MDPSNPHDDYYPKQELKPRNIDLAFANKSTLPLSGLAPGSTLTVAVILVDDSCAEDLRKMMEKGAYRSGAGGFKGSGHHMR